MMIEFWVKILNQLFPHVAIGHLVCGKSKNFEVKNDFFKRLI